MTGLMTRPNPVEFSQGHEFYVAMWQRSALARGEWGVRTGEQTRAWLDEWDAAHRVRIAALEVLLIERRMSDPLLDTEPMRRMAGDLERRLKRAAKAYRKAHAAAVALEDGGEWWAPTTPETTTRKA